jgi:hypothetical protein
LALLAPTHRAALACREERIPKWPSRWGSASSQHRAKSKMGGIG